MNDAKKFNYFVYPLVKTKMEKEDITIPHLSHLTGISPNTLYHILRTEENFEKSSFLNIQVILSALKISEQLVVNDYYRSMYDLGNDDCNVIAITNIIDGAKSYKLSEEDFNLVKNLLERLNLN